MISMRSVRPGSIASHSILFAAFSVLMVSLPLHAQQSKSMPLDPIHAWNAGSDPASLEMWVNERLRRGPIGRQQSHRSQRCPHSSEHAPAFRRRGKRVGSRRRQSYFMFAVGDSAPLRDKAQAMASRVSSALTDISLNQKVYRALAAVPSPTNDPATRHYLERTLLEYRLAGVDKDDATRAKIRQLQDKNTALSLTFNRNIDDDVRKERRPGRSWMACRRTTLRATSPMQMESIP